MAAQQALGGLARARPGIADGEQLTDLGQPQPDSHFAITAYELLGKAAMAYRRRRRRKR